MQVSQFLMWMFWLLGKTPDKQEKLRNEITTNIGDSPVTVDTLGHLPYLKACVKETFRFSISFMVSDNTIVIIHVFDLYVYHFIFTPSCLDESHQSQQG